MRRLVGPSMLFLALLSGCSTLFLDTYDYGKVEVFATMESGEPAVGIPLLLYRNREHLAYGVTDSRGEYSFSFVPFGSVGVYAQLAPAYETADGFGSDYRDSIDVSDGGTAVVSFTGWRKLSAEPEPIDGETAVLFGRP